MTTSKDPVTGDTKHTFGSIVAEDEGGRNLTLFRSHRPTERFTIEHADRWDLLAAIMSAQGQAPFDKRCADAMADAIDLMVRTKQIDARSPAADALLSYREGEPMTERSDQLVELTQQRDSVYRERNQCVAAMAKMAIMMGWFAYLGHHEDSDAGWDPEWKTIVFIETPAGQCSWHIHDRELGLFAFLPRRPIGAYKWDGHTTEEKYRRLASLGVTRPL